jgi:hypothetical protein
MFPIMSAAARIQALEAQLGTLSAAVAGLPWRVATLPAVQLANNADLPGKAAVEAMTMEVSLAAVTTEQTLVSYTGAGVLQWASLHASVASAATLRLIIELDGVSVFDSSVVNASITNRHIIGCGASYAGTYDSSVWFDYVPFRASLVIKASRSLTTGAAVVQYRYTPMLTPAA